MNKERLILFSDAFFAIIMTIMVLELKVPIGHSFKSLVTVLPTFSSYIMSFVFLSIFWIHHHHLFSLATKINAKLIWANMILLFFLSLIPFATSWVGESEKIYRDPVIFYILIMFLTGICFRLLTRLIVKTMAKDSLFAKTLLKGKKGITTLVLNFIAILLAFFTPTFAIILLFIVLITWIIPDKGFEKEKVKSCSCK